MVVTSPLELSCKLTTKLSPEFMKRSVLGLGVKVAAVELTGLGGACGTPLLVTKAKLTGSMLTIFWQAAFSSWPVLSFDSKLSMVSAAHQRAASQLLPGGQATQPGG